MPSHCQSCSWQQVDAGVICLVSWWHGSLRQWWSPVPAASPIQTKKNNDDSTVRDGETKISHHFMIMVWNRHPGPLILLINKSTMKTNMAPPMVWYGRWWEVLLTSPGFRNKSNMRLVTWRSGVTTVFSDRWIMAEGSWIIAKPCHLMVWERWFFMKNLRNLKLQ